MFTASLLALPAINVQGRTLENGRLAAENAFTQAGTQAQAIRSTREPSPSLPPVGRLPRPVLLIAGGVSKPMGLKNFIEYLTASGANQFGGVINVEKTAEFIERFKRLDPAKGQLIFTLELSRHFSTFDHDAAEIAEAIRILSQLARSKVDCLAESKAAVEVRMVLRDGGDQIANLILLVPIVRGIPIVGDLAWLLIHLPLPRFGPHPNNPEIREVLKGWTTDIKIGPWVWNKHLRPLNEPDNLRRERESVERLTIIAGGGHNILSRRLGPGLPIPWLKGDGDVPLSHSRLSSADEILVFTGDQSLHKELLVNPEVLSAVARILQEGTETSLAARRSRGRD